MITPLNRDYIQAPDNIICTRSLKCGPANRKERTFRVSEFICLILRIANRGSLVLVSPILYGGKH